MKIIPYDKCVIRSPLSVDQLKERLADHLEPRKLVRSPFNRRKKYKAYEGYVTGNTFAISRIIDYRNSFLPEIQGKFLSADKGSRVVVEMRLNEIILVFLAVFCLVLILVFLVVVNYSFRSGSFNPVVLIPLGILMIMVFATSLAFNAERDRSQRDLVKFFSGEIEE